VRVLAVSVCVVNVAMYRASVELARSAAYMLVNIQLVPNVNTGGGSMADTNDDCGVEGCPMGLVCPNEARISHAMDGNSDGGGGGCSMDFTRPN
jgi:hypothetical protein